MDHKIEKIGISLSFEIIGANMRILGVNELFLIRTNYILFLCQKSGFFFFFNATLDWVKQDLCNQNQPS